VKILKKNDKTRIVAGQSERTFMTGVLVLSLSTLIVKIIGLAYKLPLLSILGAEGMGYFNSAYEIYAMLCVISTSGLPIAVSILISGALERGDLHGAEKIYRTSLTVLGTLGFFGSAALCAFARPIASFIGNPDAYYCILTVSPALLFACVSGAQRGYFQGRRNMSPTAVSQLIEALGKLLLGVSLAAFAKNRGFSVSAVAAFAALGLVIGSFASTAYLAILKLLSKKRKAQGLALPDASNKGVLGKLIRIALPITLGSALLGITRVIDMTLIMRRLQDVGISSAAANKIYGSYATLALPVFSLIPALVTPISESLIPRLSAAVETGEKIEQRAAVERSVKLTALIGIPASMGISLYAEQILKLIFSNQEEATAIAYPLLSALGASVLFSCLITTTNSVLQAYRKVMLPIISMAAGAVVKTLSAYFLIGYAGIGALGAPISTLLCNATVVGMNLYFVGKAVPSGTGTASLLVKPFFASVAAIGLSVGVYLPTLNTLESEKIAFLAAMLSACAAYIGFGFLFGAISTEDLASLPFLEKIFKANKKKYNIKEKK